MVSSFLDRFAPIDFTRYIDRLTDRFTGREWLFEQIDQWLQQQGKEQFYLLTGEPGVGKSAIVAQLIKRWQAQPKSAEQGKLAAYHFCRAGDVETVRPGRVLRSIAAQLGNTLPHYGKALKKVLEQVHLNIDININIGNLTNSQVTGIYIENLKDLDPREELRLLIQAPLAELPAIYAEERTDLPALKVFLIDSLDEAVTTTGRDNVATLLAALSQTNDLPPWIQVILTARPNSSVLQDFQSIQSYKLEELFSKNLEDIEQYVHDRLQELVVAPEFQTRLEQAELSPEKLVDTVKTLSEGNFLYTRLVMDGIGTSELSLSNLSALPKNLNEVYQRFLRHRCPVRKWIHLYQPILGTLTVTQEAVSASQLVKFVSVVSDQIQDEAQVEGAIAILQQFLDEVEDDQGQKLYTIFHQSLREYLLDRKNNHDFWCDAKEQNDNIIKYCEQKSQNWQDLRAIDLYGLRHLAQHLVKGDRVEELHILLSLEKDGKNAWFKVKDDKGETASFLADIEIAWSQADESYNREPQQSIGLQCRYALITTSINSQSNNISVPFLATLVECQVWTITKALAYCQRSTNPEKRFYMLNQLIPFTPKALQDEVLKRALIATQAIPYISGQIDALEKLLPVLPQSLAEQALQNVLLLAQTNSSNNYGGRVGEQVNILMRLVPHLPKFQRDIVLNQAVNIVLVLDVRYQSSFLIKLLEQTSGELQEKVLQALLQLTQLTSERDKTEVLAKITPYLPESEQSKMFEHCVQAILDVNRGDFVSTIIPKISKSLSDKILERVFRKVLMESSLIYNAQVELLVEIIPIWVKISGEEILQKVMKTLRRNKNIRDQINLLVKLLPALSEMSKNQVLEYISGIEEKAIMTIKKVDGNERISLLIELIPILSKDYSEEVAQDALKEISAIQYEDSLSRKSTRFQFLSQVIICLPDSLRDRWQQILDETLAGFKVYDKYRPLKLHRLTPYVSESFKNILLNYALDEAEHIEDSDGPDRASFLADLAPYLTEKLMSRAMSIANAASYRAETVTNLAAYLKLPISIKQQILNQSITVIQVIEDNRMKVDIKAKLIPLCSKLFKKETEEKLLGEVLGLDLLWHQDDCLKDLLPHLPDSLVNKTLLTIHQRRGDLLKFIPVLSSIQQKVAMQFVSHAIESLEDTRHRDTMLSTLILHLNINSNQVFVERVFNLIQTVGDIDWQTRLLTQIAPQLPESTQRNILEQAVRVAQTIEEDWQGCSVKAFLEVIPLLSGKFKEQVVLETLTKAKIIPSDVDRVQALAMLSPHLSLALSDESALFCVQAVGNDNFRAKFLDEIFPSLPYFLQEHVFNAIKTIPDEESQAQALTQIIPYLTNKLKRQDVLHIAREFQVGRNRTLVELELTGLLSEQERYEILKPVLEEIRILHHSIFDWRERLPKLKKLVPKLTTLSDTTLYDLWKDTLHFLTCRDRSNLLADLGELSPVIFRLGGTKAAENVFRAVEEVGKQW